MTDEERNGRAAESEKPMDLAAIGKRLAQVLGDRETAEWAFDFLEETARRLGISSEADERLAVTLRGDLSRIHFNFCSWLIAGISGSEDGEVTVRIPLIREKMNQLADKPDYKEDYVHKSDPAIVGCRFNLPDFKAFREEILALYDLTLKRIARRFSGSSRSPYRSRHLVPLGRAVFDNEFREKLFRIAFSDPESGAGPIKVIRSLAGLAEETSYPTDDLDTWLKAIERKGQAILYGPPGTGKTWLAEKLARHLADGGDGWVEMIQFHPAYTYEDFIQGIRPETAPDGTVAYRLMPGRFLRFCREAERRNGTCVLIIDEINRAHLSSVFGELMIALEYRDREIPLAAGGSLRVPGNVRIIGTMNTADRSIALVDHAFRRRFAFLRLDPRYDVLKQFHRRRGVNTDRLIRLLRKVNRNISDPDCALGISFFLVEDLERHLETIWKFEVEPYLEEIFADQPELAEAWRWNRIRGELKP
jgi:hypothetical protein